MKDNIGIYNEMGFLLFNRNRVRDSSLLLLFE